MESFKEYFLLRENRQEQKLAFQIDTSVKNRITISFFSYDGREIVMSPEDNKNAKFFARFFYKELDDAQTSAKRPVYSYKNLIKFNNNDEDSYYNATVKLDKNMVVILTQPPAYKNYKKVLFGDMTFDSKKSNGMKIKFYNTQVRPDISERFLINLAKKFVENQKA